MGFWCDGNGKSREIIYASPRDTNYNNTAFVMNWQTMSCNGQEHKALLIPNKDGISKPV